MDTHSLALRPDARRRSWIRWPVFCLSLLLAGTLSAQGTGEPSAAALFYGDRDPVASGGKGFRPANEPGTQAIGAATAKPGAATPSGASASPTRPGLRVWLTDANDAKRRLSPQQTFRTGDRMRLAVQPNRDGHLYVVNVGSSGRTQVLYPRPGQDNRVRAFQDFAFASPLVFSEPAGTEQLVLVLADAPLDEVSVRLGNGSQQRLALRSDGAGGRNAAADSLTLALADLQGSKDLKFDDDGAELIAVSGRVDERRGASFAPVVINLRLTHRR